MVEFLCQNPELACNLETILAPANLARVCSIMGIGWFSHSTVLFSWMKSPHILTLPFFFGRTTTEEHYSVGWSTFLMMPMSSIRFNSAWTFGSSGSGILRGVVRLNGVTPPQRLISYSPGIQPNPVNTFGCVLFVLPGVVPGEAISSTFATTPSFWQAILPSYGRLRSPRK